MPEPAFDVATAHRWFAVEANNAVWGWLESGATADPTDPIVHAAHASCHHWLHAGTAIHHARAASLLANVHAAVGNGAAALTYAGECAQLLVRAGTDATDWDAAFAADSLARALRTAGDPTAADHRAKARAAGDAIVDPGDKQVFNDWFNLRWPDPLQ